MKVGYHCDLGKKGGDFGGDYFLQRSALKIVQVNGFGA